MMYQQAFILETKCRTKDRVGLAFVCKRLSLGCWFMRKLCINKENDMAFLAIFCKNISTVCRRVKLNITFY